jgi:glycosyltransferase involved in cell wall biosynthesis
MLDRIPKISVYTTCKNNGRYLAATLDSIFRQTCTDFELVVVDGASTDDTVSILKQYGNDPRLKWISEPDENAVQGFYKALSLTRGQYIMCLPISDCYLSSTWFDKCVALLDLDIEISLVHGNLVRMHEDGSLLNPLHPRWCEVPPPDKYDYFAYWLATFMHASEITYCVRSKIYKQCYPAYAASGTNYACMSDPLTDVEFEQMGPHLKFLYNFHTNGYLARYLPIIASGARENSDNLTTAQKRYVLLEARKYASDIIQYRENILKQAVVHRFRNGLGEIIRALELAELGQFEEKIRYYREHERLMFDFIDEDNLYHRLRADLFRNKWKHWSDAFESGCPVAIYGGGMHTEQLFEILGEDVRKLNIVAVIDQRPMHGDTLRGIPIIQTAAFDFSKVDHVIISSKCYENEIYGELLRFLPSWKVERIYAG